MAGSVGGLKHTPAASRTGLATGRRAGLIARGRQEAARGDADNGYDEAVKLYRDGFLTEAATMLRTVAADGHAEAQYLLSTWLDAGDAVAEDPDEAATWERRAAEQGHAYAQANRSYRSYQAGDFAEAFQWCQRAAYSQLPWAQFHLGLLHRKGEGTPQSDAEAAHWYRLAAQQGLPEAQLKLAELYYFGTGVPLSHAQAAAWYRRAAELGHAEAQFQLAHLLATGQGVETDYAQSRLWVRKAAEQGHAEAVRELKRREYRDP